MEAIPLKQLEENLKTGRVSREDFYLKILRELDKMCVSSCLDRMTEKGILRSAKKQYESIDMVLEELDLVWTDDREPSYGEIISQLKKYREYDNDILFEAAMKALWHLGNLFCNASRDEEELFGKGIL
jgi:hypothetical protein